MLKGIVGEKKKKRVDFPGRPVVQNLPANAGNTGSILVQEDTPCHRATKTHEPRLLTPVP